MEVRMNGTKNRRMSPLATIFMTVFVDLIGFGIVLPLLPTYSKSLGAKGLMVGVIMASYSAMQFLFAPVWGAWSDRVGRRPALLLSTGGAAASYAVFAYGSTLSGSMALSVILLSRVIAGICAANITVAQAYIADITPPEESGKRMGLIGMAFGLGFIIGPLVAVAGQGAMGRIGPGILACAICTTNFFFAWKFLPESWRPGLHPAAPKRSRFAGVQHVLGQPVIGFLVFIFFLATFGFTCFESNLAILVTQNFQLNDKNSYSAGAVLFSFAGIMGATVQSPGIWKSLKKLGEPRLVAISLLLFAVGLAPMPWIKGNVPLTWANLFSAHGGSWWILLLFVTLIAIGSGMTRPPLFALIQRCAPAQERGLTFGVAQSGASLARIVGPLFIGGLYDSHPAWPYLACAGLASVTGLLAWKTLTRSSEIPANQPQGPVTA